MASGRKDRSAFLPPHCEVTLGKRDRASLSLLLSVGNSPAQLPRCGVRAIPAPGRPGPCGERPGCGGGKSASAETQKPLLRPVFVIPHTFRSSDWER